MEQKINYETVSIVGNLLFALCKLKLISDITDRTLMCYMYDKRLRYTYR